MIAEQGSHAATRSREHSVSDQRQEDAEIMHAVIVARAAGVHPMILDGAGIDMALHGAATDPRTYLLRFYPDLSIPPLDHVATDVEPLTARVNGAHWIASCPCGAKGVPSPGGIVWLDRPLVWCVRCENEAVGGGWRLLTVPPLVERQLIEAVLACRPSPGDRNWEGPSETVADLIAQNREHGDPIPEDGESPIATASKERT